MPAPETRASLLLRIRDPLDRDAWEEFSALYRPVVMEMARGRGMQNADAEDLAQHVLVAISGAIERCDVAAE
jgi:RNA polymerase sigma-70 factor (ECF subfamily)